jgi:quinol-cytochrome oxidoreductase complex cytochrome b subunit
MSLTLEDIKPQNLEKTITTSQIWKSMFRNWPWKDTPRHRSRHIVDNVWLHLHPIKVRPRALEWTFTWGLGGISFLLFLILTVTGVLLMFYYRPTVELAYQDMKDLEFVVSLGKVLRNSHRWAAHAMVMAVILHMIRVFLTGSYKKPREFNWGVGVILLTLTLFLSFTGYLLPWDQLAIWAVTVGTNMAAATPVLGNEGPFANLLGMTISNDVRFVLLGGTTVGANTLLRFYVMHCVLVPLVAAALMIVHFWRIRKDTFSAAPYTPDEDKLDVWPNLVVREYIAAAFTIIFILAWSILQNAPLETIADPNVTPNPSKAPWYFLGLQELLVYFDPWIAGVLLPGVIIGGLCAIPYVDTNTKGIGYYTWNERPFANGIFMFGIAMWFILIIIGVFCRGPNYFWYWPWESWLITKPAPDPTWSFPIWLGILSIVGYFTVGMLGPRVVKSDICWKKATIGFGVFFALLGAGMKFGADIAMWRIGVVGMLLYLTFLFGFLYPQRYLKDLDWVRYGVVQKMNLLMMAVLLKMGLRLGLDIKYILEIPAINFNI